VAGGQVRRPIVHAREQVEVEVCVVHSTTSIGKSGRNLVIRL
jgi:hypothetical protein